MCSRTVSFMLLHYVEIFCRRVQGWEITLHLNIASWCLLRKTQGTLSLETCDWKTCNVKRKDKSYVYITEAISVLAYQTYKWTFAQPTQPIGNWRWWITIDNLRNIINVNRLNSLATRKKKEKEYVSELLKVALTKAGRISTIHHKIQFRHSRTAGEAF